MKNKHIASLAIILLMSGCASAAQTAGASSEIKKTETKKINEERSSEEKSDEIIASLKQCESALFVLKEIKSNKYQPMLKVYKKAAAKVSLYTSVRNSLPKENIDSLDSVFLISTQSTCDQIEAVAQQGVLSQLPM